MSARNFREILENKWAEGRQVCVGLDTEFEKIPSAAYMHRASDRSDIDIGASIFKFNRAIVDATVDLVCAYKANFAFYAAHGPEGLRALRWTFEYIRDINPTIAMIFDGKRADIGHTNGGYVKEAFHEYKAHAITVNPYFGQEALKPFLDQQDKGVIVLCRTSNPGAGEFQDLLLGDPSKQGPDDSCVKLFEYVARQVAEKWNTNGNCALVVGATYPDELARVRQIVGDMPILIPGIGAQGGDVEATVKAGMDSRKSGMIVNASRSIIYAKPQEGESIGDAARRETLKLHSLINQYRQETPQ